jgi:hypothetical protein
LSPDYFVGGDWRLFRPAKRLAIVIRDAGWAFGELQSAQLTPMLRDDSPAVCRVPA